jgi:hypothetical protein
MSEIEYIIKKEDEMPTKLTREQEWMLLEEERRGIRMGTKRAEPATSTAEEIVRLIEQNTIKNAAIDHPSHYGGKNNPYEAIKVIEAWELGFCLGNVVKYISRAGKKHENVLEDLKKARWYLDRHISKLEGKNV